jgi:hypothetical protein
MKIKPGIVRPASVPSGQARGWTFTMIIEIDEDCQFEVIYNANIPRISHAKNLMRETINKINSEIIDDSLESYDLNIHRNFGHS